MHYIDRTGAGLTEVKAAIGASLFTLTRGICFCR